MAAQCCVCHFLLVNNADIHPISHRFHVIALLVRVSLSSRVPFFNAQSSVVSENITVSHVLSKTRFLEYIFVADSRHKLKATKFGEMTQNNGHYAFKVIQGHHLEYQRKACDFLLVNNTNLTAFLAPFLRYRRLLVKFTLSTGTPLFKALDLG